MPNQWQWVKQYRLSSNSLPGSTEWLSRTLLHQIIKVEVIMTSLLRTTNTFGKLQLSYGNILVNFCFQISFNQSQSCNPSNNSQTIYWTPPPLITGNTLEIYQGYGYFNNLYMPFTQMCSVSHAIRLLFMTQWKHNHHLLPVSNSF